jgi:hypothetical protein
MKLPAITESQFQRQVLELARLHGWITAHFRPGMTRKGRWMTAVAGDGVGFPDLVLVRDRVIYAELKTDVGRIRVEQARWIKLLRRAGQEVYVWRPANWQVIEETLR